MVKNGPIIDSLPKLTDFKLQKTKLKEMKNRSKNTDWNKCRRKKYRKLENTENQEFRN